MPHNTLHRKSPRGSRRRGPYRGRPRLSESQIIHWAKDHIRRVGQWPRVSERGPVHGVPGENWRALDIALRDGLRGLPGGSSLTRLLCKQGGLKVERRWRPILTLDQIWRWAQAHHKKHGTWPRAGSGPIEGSQGDTWSKIDSALQGGTRGLPGGVSLRSFLIDRGVALPSPTAWRPTLTLEQIWKWAREYHDQHGEWPRHDSGGIEGTDQETWQKINSALDTGFRGLPGGSSLTKLLVARGARPPLHRRRKLTLEQIKAWARAYHKKHGHWPHVNSGPIEGTERESWSKTNAALWGGLRGLPGGSSLARLFGRKPYGRNG